MHVNVPNVITRASKKASFHWRSIQPRSRPSLCAQGRHIVSQLNHADLYATTLDQLAITGTSRMLALADQLLADLPQKNSVEFKGERSVTSHSVGLSARQLLDYPDVFMWGVQSQWLDWLEHYFRQPVAYLGCILRREVPNQKQVGVRLWHKDGEDYKVIKVIIYLNDVTAEVGPFEYIPKNQTPTYHQFRQVNNIVRDRDMAQVVPQSKWQQCVGARGTVVIANTASLFHHAALPQQHRHSITFAYVSTVPKNLAKCRQWCPHDGTDAWLKIQSALSSRQWQALMSWR